MAAALATSRGTFILVEDKRRELSSLVRLWSGERGWTHLFRIIWGGLVQVRIGRVLPTLLRWHPGREGLSTVT